MTLAGPKSSKVIDPFTRNLRKRGECKGVKTKDLWVFLHGPIHSSPSLLTFSKFDVSTVFARALKLAGVSGMGIIRYMKNQCLLSTNNVRDLLTSLILSFLQNKQNHSNLRARICKVETYTAINFPILFNTPLLL